ncbi:YbaN family protein [Planctomyces sp. SH-PL14]|uniref:YbaN family protein n=1 Tax=Planctomyces sp. SH-PL14 TaxID=1632864 RepID=UPI0009463D18|nr:YbaN family protein [Planctomyces sp. SH-PL14]
MRRWLYVSAGLVSVGLGVLGAFLPVLPTTPFLLLASWAFMKSDPRWHAWLLRLPRFGPMIRDWDERRAVPRRAKRTAYVVVPSVIALTVFTTGFSSVGTILIIVLGVIGLTVVWHLPSADAVSSTSAANDPLEVGER